MANPREPLEDARERKLNKGLWQRMQEGFRTVMIARIARRDVVKIAILITMEFCGETALSQERKCPGGGVVEHLRCNTMRSICKQLWVLVELCNRCLSNHWYGIFRVSLLIRRPSPISAIPSIVISIPLQWTFG